MAIEIYDSKILLNSGKIAVDAACCCGSSPYDPPDPEPDPWPDDLPAWCRCYELSIPPTATLTISGIPKNGDNASCGAPCVPPYYLARYNCMYDAMNGTYGCTVYPYAPHAIYGECIVGTVGDDSDPGIQIEERYDCFGGAVYSQKYLWKVKFWYSPCEACLNDFGGADMTRVKGNINVSLNYQEWYGVVTPGCTPATCTFYTGSSFIYGDCYDNCKHVALCYHANCDIYQTTYSFHVDLAI